MGKIVKVKSVEPLTPKSTHLVQKIILEKPEGITYEPGQAVDFAINKPEWKDQVRTFTFVSLQEDDHLEFNIKSYPEHDGVTNQLRFIKPGDEIIIGDVYGDIHYKGKGIFMAGGAGITPFLAILFYLNKKKELAGNKLIFANKTRDDIIREQELREMLGDKNFINVFSDQEISGYEHGYITKELIKKNADPDTKYYYLCGPPPMQHALLKMLDELGIDEEHIIKEGFE